jgi:hypothetical protein
VKVDPERPGGPINRLDALIRRERELLQAGRERIERLPRVAAGFERPSVSL